MFRGVLTYWGLGGTSKSAQYKNEVFDILHKSKARFKEELRQIQTEIEDMTMLFDEESIYKTRPNLIR